MRFKISIIMLTLLIIWYLLRNEEFLRIGYYVRNEYTDEKLREEPPDVPQVHRLMDLWVELTQHRWTNFSEQ